MVRRSPVLGADGTEVAEQGQVAAGFEVESGRGGQLTELVHVAVRRGVAAAVRDTLVTGGAEVGDQEPATWAGHAVHLPERGRVVRLRDVVDREDGGHHVE
jgi:hypothetical protein